jgi:sulfotransferase family protein
LTLAPDPRLLDSRLRELVPVDQPLLLISQAQRSGGTLLLRLLDGHPQCHVAPFQLRGFDEAAKRAPIQAEEAWKALYDPKLAERFQRGHRQRKHDVLHHDEVFPFELEPSLQRAIYDACTGRIGEPTARDLVDCYFTSYFNAWLDYGNLRARNKRLVVGFEPGVARSLRRRRGVQSLYPEGKIVTIVRDPWSWFASARRWEGRWADRERALDHWCEVGRGTIKLRRERKPNLRILSFEDLLTKTEETLRRLTAWLGIDFRPELLLPTFNGRPIRANTSFGDVGKAVSTRPLERGREELTDDDVAYINERAGEIYGRLAKKAGKDWAASASPSP